MTSTTPIRTRITTATVVSTVAVLASGCGVTNDLRVDDKSTTLASARAVYRIDGGSGGIELDYGNVRGTGPQTLNPFGGPVTLGGQSINAPATLQHDVRLQHAQLAYNHLLFKGRPVEMEWFVGVSSTHLAWRARSSNPADPVLTGTRRWTGPAGGALGRVNLGAGFALEGRFGASASLDSAKATRTQAEAALAFSPVPALQLRAGMAQSYTDTEYSGADSQQVLRTRGPFLGVLIGF